MSLKILNGFNNFILKLSSINKQMQCAGLLSVRWWPYIWMILFSDRDRDKIKLELHFNGFWLFFQPVHNQEIKYDSFIDTGGQNNYTTAGWHYWSCYW